MVVHSRAATPPHQAADRSWAQFEIEDGPKVSDFNDRKGLVEGAGISALEAQRVICSLFLAVK
jgi:hypothetical protein